MTTRAPGVQFRPWFHGRDPAIAAGACVPGSDGAEDLATLVVPLVEPISAGRPPVAPKLPSTIEIEPVALGASVLAASGRRVTRSNVVAGGDFVNDDTTPPVLWRVILELEWGPMTAAEWALLKEFLLSPAKVGLTGSGALRAMTIDVDGDGLTDSAVDVRLLAVESVEQLVEWDGAQQVYRFGPVKAEEVL